MINYVQPITNGAEPWAQAPAICGPVDIAIDIASYTKSHMAFSWHCTLMHHMAHRLCIVPLTLHSNDYSAWPLHKCTHVQPFAFGTNTTMLSTQAIVTNVSSNQCQHDQINDIGPPGHSQFYYNLGLVRVISTDYYYLSLKFTIPFACTSLSVQICYYKMLHSQIVQHMWYCIAICCTIPIRT